MKFLSDVLDIRQFQRGRINLIEAPCGCGKTTCAKGMIANLASSRNKVLYLIDTRNGCNVLANQPDAVKLNQYDIGTGIHYGDMDVLPYDLWDYNFNKQPRDKIWVSTYANLGFLVSEYSRWILNGFEIIIADEIHNMIQFPRFSQQPNAASMARDAIMDATINSRNLVIGISATPEILRTDRRYNSFLNEIQFDRSNLQQYKNGSTRYFTDVKKLLNELPEGKKGMLYTTRIEQMQEFEKIAKASGRNPIAIWSMSNMDHPMTPLQTSVRNKILEEEAIPPEYDLFIFNASAETAINIRSDIDFVIVNNTNHTHITQARGRVRHDIETLYLPQPVNQNFLLDSTFLNHPLTPQEKREMRLSTGLKDPHGKPLPYEQLKTWLLDKGYTWANDKEGRIIITAPS